MAFTWVQTIAANVDKIKKEEIDEIRSNTDWMSNNIEYCTAHYATYCPSHLTSYCTSHLTSYYGSHLTGYCGAHYNYCTWNHAYCTQHNNTFT